AERARAPLLYQTLTRAKNRIESGSRDYPAIENDALLSLQQAGFRPDYFSVRCAQDLAPAAPGDTALVILAAARLGQARLIDNVRLTLTGQNPL
ncbi:MAG: pantoate--beta-alanine ligase, partial [Gammaproteobacteria bacterium]